MRLGAKLTYATVSVATVGTFVLGAFAAQSMATTQLTALDHALNLIVAEVDPQSADPLAEAMLAADRSPIAVSLGFLAPGTQVAMLREPVQGSTPVPSARDLNAAVDELVTVVAPESYRLRAIELPDQEVLFVSASTADIDEGLRRNLILLGGFVLLLSVVIGLLIRAVMRRDIDRIEELVAVASRIADGESGVDVPRLTGANEIVELSEALHRVVDSLRRSVELEQRSSARMQEFVGDASHELRTPLTVIRGYVEMLSRAEGVDAEQRQRALTRVQREVHRMESLVGDLLLLVEAGVYEPNAESVVDLSMVVREQVEDLRAFQPERAIDAVIADRVRVHGDEEYVHRAIVNAFANIRRHTPGTAAVRVTLIAGGPVAHLVIEDGGPGLSPEMYARGIQHFQRFDKSRSREHGGSGLGMSILSAIMHGLGGDVRIEPSDLGGLRLVYEFPRV